MLRKTIIAFSALLLALIAAACGGVQLEDYPDGTVTIAADIQPTAEETPAPNSLPREATLVLGMLMLDKTGQAVNAAQAGTLIPLLQQLQAIDTNPAATDADLAGVLDQIQAGLTDDQNATIAGMGLRQSDLFTYLQTSGLWVMMMETGIPGFPGGGEDTPVAGAAAPTDDGDGPGYRHGFYGMPPILLDSLIRLLQQK